MVLSSQIHWPAWGTLKEAVNTVICPSSMLSIIILNIDYCLEVLLLEAFELLLSNVYAA